MGTVAEWEGWRVPTLAEIYVLCFRHLDWVWRKSCAVRFIVRLMAAVAVWIVFRLPAHAEPDLLSSFHRHLAGLALWDSRYSTSLQMVARAVITLATRVLIRDRSRHSANNRSLHQAHLVNGMHF
jgi:hypothetical protein